MAVICTSNFGWLISHEQFINANYRNTSTIKNIKKSLFNIQHPYISRKLNASVKKSRRCNLINCEELEADINQVQNKYNLMLQEFKNHFCETTDDIDNKEALKESELVYNKTNLNLTAIGSNNGPAIINVINDEKFIFPKNCEFFSKDVLDMSDILGARKFDLILLDPPWWNKYIRRKRKKTEHGYDMMYNHDLQNLPLKEMLSLNGIIVIWCTNSLQHLNFIRDKLFPHWDVKYIGKWYWMKVTTSGQPVTKFSTPTQKQPFEQIIFGSRTSTPIPDGKIVISVPSALHSHKPPLVELLLPYFPEKPACLEIFARYLLPNWTSYGNEVLKFQHECLFEFLDAT